LASEIGLFVENASTKISFKAVRTYEGNFLLLRSLLQKDSLDQRGGHLSCHVLLDTAGDRA
jgi:hypothetical protein